MRSVRLPRRRVEAWLEALARVERTASRLAGRLGRVTVLLHGSYARGDFNLWSDIDVIVVSDAFKGVRVLDRYDMVASLLEPSVEPVLVTPGEFEGMLSKPSWRQALARGVVVVRDDYGVAGMLQRLGIRVVGLAELVERVRGLLRWTVEL